MHGFEALPDRNAGELRRELLIHRTSQLHDPLADKKIDAAEALAARRQALHLDQRHIRLTLEIWYGHD